MAKECTDHVVCLKCSEEHKIENCKSQLNKCINCVMSNQKFGMSLKVDVTWDRHNVIP